MEIWARRQQRREVQALVEFIFRPFRVGAGKLFLKGRFGYEQKQAIDSLIQSGSSTKEAAVILASLCIGFAIEKLVPADKRKIVCFAYLTGNMADPTAEALTHCYLNVLHLKTNDASSNAFRFELAGALRGMTASERESYRMAASIDEVLKRLETPDSDLHRIG
jgi:hypothetical protein